MEGPAKRALRILLVDDDHCTVTALVRLLSQAGHEVNGAQNLSTALDLVREERYDVLLCDIHLREAYGYAVLKAVREMYPIRAIAITGYGLPADLAAAAEAGFTEVLLKPIDPARLLSSLEVIGIEIDRVKSLKRPLPGPRQVARIAVG